LTNVESKQQRRTWKGYIASPTPIALGEVVPVGPISVVVMAEFTREAWEAERQLPPRDPADEGDRTFGRFNSQRSSRVPAFDGERETPEGFNYFYGVEYSR
jgi:hypothetical protein